MNLKGIDVSYHNGAIDWKRVKNSGVEFAIIRAGYGKKTMDKKFTENIVGALTAGIRVGIYWFIYAKDTEEAVLNALACHSIISGYKDSIDMGVWADWEYDSDKRNPQTKSTRTEIVKTFCETLKERGWNVGVYANPDYLNTKFGDLKRYPLWLAKYSASKGNYDPDIWQHTSKGTVHGINGNVDMNIMYRDISQGKEDGVFKNPYPEPQRSLYKKLVPMRGDDVKWLQTELIRHDCLSTVNKKGKSNVDGILGKYTSDAIIAFQTRAGIGADGICGKVTKEHLKK